MQFEDNIEKLLKELEELQKSGRFPNIDRDTALFLFNLVTTNNFKNIFEIGSCNGYSTLWLALAARETGGKVMTVEWGKDKFGWLMENLEKSGLLEFIEPINDDALNVLDKQKDKIDFLFIDGVASLYLEFIKKAEPHFHSNTIIIADNTESHQEKLQDFLDYVKMNDTYEVAEHNLGGGVLEIRKKNDE